MAIARVLWPGHPPPQQVLAAGRHPRGVARDWWVLPAASRPRMLVPVGTPAARRMLTRHGSALGARAGRAVLARGVGSQGLTALPWPRLRVPAAVAVRRPAEQISLEAVLAQVLERPVTSGVLLGTPRVNRKPVVQVFDEAGHSVAFVKVGVDAGTRDLVATEAANLALIRAGGLRLVEPPSVLHDGPLGTRATLLALSPLHSSQGERSVQRAPLEAMTEIAAVAGVGSGPLRGLPWWQSRRERAVGYPLLAILIDRIEARFADTVVHTGSWHGDWAPWNMGHADGRVQVWDWERFESGVPWGFDAVHYRIQAVRHLSDELADQQRAFLADMPDLLAGMGAPGRDQDVDLLTLAYLVEIALRFSSTSAAHPRAVWAQRFARELIDG